MQAPRLFASTRSVDPLELGAAAARLAAAGVDGLHVDLSDGHFVPELGASDSVVGALVARTAVSVEVHLMVTAPERYLGVLGEAGVRRVLVHLETTPYPWRTCRLARSLGLEVGLAANFATPVVAIEAAAPSADFVNLLTTDPDLAGERLLPGAAERVAAVRAVLPPGMRIEVDGDIGPYSIGRLAAAGAADFVVGRALAEADDWQERVERLRAAAVAGVSDPSDVTN